MEYDMTDAFLSSVAESILDAYRACETLAGAISENCSLKLRIKKLSSYLLICVLYFEQFAIGKYFCRFYD